MVFIFGALIVTAAVGMARNESGLAVMGQVACFVIPILAILWIRVRKEGKARARKQVWMEEGGDVDLRRDEPS